MTPEIAMSTTHWDRVAAKAGIAGPVLAYPTERRLVVTHGERRRVCDPLRDERWLDRLIVWLAEGAS